MLMHRKMSQYSGESRCEGWVYGITRNVALQRRRKKSGERGCPSLRFQESKASTTRTPERVSTGSESPPTSGTSSSDCRLRQREVFDLVDLQGHDPAEVAKVIGMKPATVRANLFKARASIRAHLVESHPAWGEIEPMTNCSECLNALSSARISDIAPARRSRFIVERVHGAANADEVTVCGVPPRGESQGSATGSSFRGSCDRRDRRIRVRSRRKHRQMGSRRTRTRCVKFSFRMGVASAETITVQQRIS